LENFHYFDVNFLYLAPWKTNFDQSETFESEFNAPAGSVRTQYMSARLKVHVLSDSVNQVKN
jgi:hypothetical protein